MFSTLLIILAMSSIPAFASGTFVDDDGNVHEANIEKIAELGISNGCAEDRFCPEDAVTRGQLASFLVRALDLAPASSSPFTDIVGHPHEEDIRALAAAGITNGCTTTSYCPNDAVTRAQSASLLARALELESSGSDSFKDDDESPHERDIEAITAAGITRGCASDLFCPDSVLKRSQMATLLARSLGVALEAPSPEPTSTTTTSTPVTIPTPPPSQPPVSSDGAVVIAAGSSIQSAIDAHPVETKFLVSAGTYTNQTITPKQGNIIIGEPGAVLDGTGRDAAIIGNGADNVIIQGLTIRNYAPGHEAAAIRSENGSRDWVIRDSEVTDVTGIAINASPGWKLINNHLHHNTQYGIRGYGDNIHIEGNDISYNNEAGGTNPYCCAGGTKFVHTDNLVLIYNHAHHNVGPGLWVDGYNTNTLYEGNTVVNNTHAGIKHEISCNAMIRDNYAEGNGFGVPHWVEGGGIVVMNSPNVEVVGNTVINNNDGIGGINAKRDIPNDHPCPIELRNFNVHDNTIVMSSGHTGIANNLNSAVYTSWGNRFQGNSYELGSASTYFRWSGGEVTSQQWLSAGNDTEGSGLP